MIVGETGMNKIELSVSIDEGEWCEFIQKYHFQPENAEELKKVYRNMKEKLNSVAFIEMTSEVKTSIPYESYCICVVTLGDGIDQIQDEYSRNEAYSEAFMVECIGMELLKRAYEQLSEIVAENYGQWLKKYDFFGDVFPLEEMKDIVDQMPESVVTCNQVYLLQPKKSVVFVAEMVNDKSEIQCNLCDSCGNTTCPVRSTKK